MSVLATDRQRSQAMEALRRANAVRAGITGVRVEIDAGELSLEEALHDDRALPMTVQTLLEAFPRVGRTRSNRILARTGMPPINPSRRVRDLTERQKGLLVDAFGRGDG